MIWIVLVAAFPSFVLGFAVCQHLYTKRIEELTRDHKSDSDSLFLNTFQAGWDAANSNVTNVKLQYDKLVNPLKYTDPK